MSKRIEVEVVENTRGAEQGLQRTGQAAEQLAAKAKASGAQMEQGLSKAGRAAEQTASKTKSASSQMTSAWGLFGSKAQGVAKDIEGASGRLSKGLSSLKGVSDGVWGSVALGATGALIAIGAGIERSVKAFASWGETVHGVMLATGASAQESSKLAFAFNVLNIDVGKGSQAMLMFARNVESGKKSVQGYFTQAQIASLKTGDMYKALLLAADGFQRQTSQMDKLQYVSSLFGARVGRQLIPLLAQGRAGVEAFGRAASELGLVLSEKDVKAAHEFEIQTRELGLALKGLEVQGGRLFTGFATTQVSMLTSYTAGITNAHGAWDKFFAAIVRPFEPMSLRGTEKELHSLANVMIQGEQVAADYEAHLKEVSVAFGETFKPSSVTSLNALDQTFRQNIASLQQYTTGLQLLAPRIQKMFPPGIADSFLAQLRGLGPGASALVGSMVTASDAQLRKLVSDFDTQTQLAEQAAELNLSKLNDIKFLGLGAEISSLAQKLHIPKEAADALGQGVARMNATSLAPLRSQMIQTFESMGATEGQANKLYDAIVDKLGSASASPKIDANTGPFNSKDANVKAHLAALNHSKGIPSADMRVAAFNAKAHAVEAEVAHLNSLQISFPVNVQGLENAASWLNAVAANARGAASAARDAAAAVSAVGAISSGTGMHDGGLVRHGGGPIPSFHAGDYASFGRLGANERWVKMLVNEFAVNPRATAKAGLPALYALNAGKLDKAAMLLARRSGMASNLIGHAGVATAAWPTGGPGGTGAATMIGPVTIPIYATPEQDARQIAREVRDELLKLERRSGKLFARS